jgi:hypothetical protein
MPSQQVSFILDFRSRLPRYIQDLTRCPAANFSIGNVFYGAFLGVVAGVHIGGYAACAIQSGITLITLSLQTRATYRGESFSLPSKFQAYANWATALVLIISTCVSMVDNDWAKAVMTILPICTYSLWGMGHWEISKGQKRKLALENANTRAEDITTDFFILKYDRLYQIAGGTADILAPFKNQPIDEIARTLGLVIMNPHLLLGPQGLSLAPIPIFIVGLSKALFKKIPFINPSKAYEAGFGVAAILALVHGDFLFAGAQAMWSLGYHNIAALGKRAKPMSADAYNRQQSTAEQSATVPL